MLAKNSATATAQSNAQAMRHTATPRGNPKAAPPADVARGPKYQPPNAITARKLMAASTGSGTEGPCIRAVTIPAMFTTLAMMP